MRRLKSEAPRSQFFGLQTKHMVKVISLIDICVKMAPAFERNKKILKNEIAYKSK